MIAGPGMAVAAMTGGVAAPAMAVPEYSYYVNGYDALAVKPITTRLA